MRKKQQVQTTGEALEKPESQIRVMWDTLKKNKAAVAGLVVILFFLFFLFRIFYTEFILKRNLIFVYIYI